MAVRLFGVDGCKDGWLVAESSENLRPPAFYVVQSFAELARQVDVSSDVVAIDIPIGLVDGPRDCDVAARRYLRPRRQSSVFPAPCRGTLDASSHPEACELNRSACGRGITLQCYGILRKIKDVDDVMTPSFQQCVRECHPEVSFAVLAGRTLDHPKKPVRGDRQRLGELERMRLLPFHVDIAAERTRLPAKASRDDFVDALVCLLTAYRRFKKQEYVLPVGQMSVDERGLRMEIVA